MTSLGDDFRKRSAEQHKAAMAVLELPTFSVEPKSQALFVVGKVTANLLELLGETVDYLHGTATMDALAKQRAKTLEKTNAIRNAAAAGEWGEFNRLVREFGGGSPAGGDGVE